MAVHVIQFEQQIPVSLQEAWDFFSKPANLQIITPAYMGFKVISKYGQARMYPGQLIEYKVKPLLGIPLYWMTEITHVEPGRYFVDEQRFGPYTLWHHQHHFEEIDGGVKMVDLVHYKLPFWFLGRLAHGLFLKKQIRGIFDYRYKKVQELFGVWGSVPGPGRGKLVSV